MDKILFGPVSVPQIMIWIKEDFIGSGANLRFLNESSAIRTKLSQLETTKNNLSITRAFSNLLKKI